MARNNPREAISFLSLFDSTVNQCCNITFDECDWCLQLLGHIRYKVTADCFNQLYAGDVTEHNQGANLIATQFPKWNDSNLKVL